ncbi:unnamed protein product [Caenorhabditis bovis]|uniref:C3H1-type domain-containing protein n=1 Tax=Caenorhabditis bovis TaxID=2654633 RepID=A0A8S1E6R7_9PELO|nr:unnamed protein product [Caenorhabditis bovis]
MDLLANYGSDGDSDEDFFGKNEEKEDEEETDEANRFIRKRKANDLVTELGTYFESSIFDNSYSREERFQMKTLSQHVDLSEKPAVDQKKAMSTCRAYLKGRCRFGDKCRFSHPVHDRSKSGSSSEAIISSNPTLYTESQEAQIFHSKKFKSSNIPE